MADKRNNKKLSPEKRAEIVDRLKAGDGPSLVARECGVGRSTVVRIQLSDVPRDTTTYGAVVHVRISADEKVAFNALATGVESSESKLLRSLIRSASGFVEMDSETIEALEKVKRELSAQGRNLNQIARAANRGRVVWSDDDKNLVQEMLSNYRQLAGFVEGTINAASRKSAALMSEVKL